MAGDYARPQVKPAISPPGRTHQLLIGDTLVPVHRLAADVVVAPVLGQQQPLTPEIIKLLGARERYHDRETGAVQVKLYRERDGFLDGLRRLLDKSEEEIAVGGNASPARIAHRLGHPLPGDALDLLEHPGVAHLDTVLHQPAAGLFHHRQHLGIHFIGPCVAGPGNVQAPLTDEAADLQQAPAIADHRRIAERKLGHAECRVDPA